MIGVIKGSDGLWITFDSTQGHTMVHVDKLIANTGPITSRAIHAACEESAASTGGACPPQPPTPAMPKLPTLEEFRAYWMSETHHHVNDLYQWFVRQLRQ